MVAIQILSLAALTVGTLAIPHLTTETTAPFKIGITFPPSKDPLYLTNTATASPNQSDGIQCTITTTKTTTSEKPSGKLSCGPEAKAFTYSEYHTFQALQPVASDAKNVDWSIGADNVIHWGAQPTGEKAVTFSRQKNGDPMRVFAEVCSTFDHHKMMSQEIREFWEGGVAKAYFV